MRKLRFFSAALVAALFGVAMPSVAHAFNHVGNAVPVTVSNQFLMVSVFQRAGDWVQLQTANLSTGSDTVIHVQNASDPSGGFVAGNDDFNGQLSSYVYVPSTTVDRTLRVIVRSYSNSAAGTCDLYVDTASGGWTFYYGKPFGGTGVPLWTNLELSTHLSTVELKNAGIAESDTVMLVVSGNDASHAVAFNDDGAVGAQGGVGYMSDISLPDVCPGWCLVVLADYKAEGPMNTKLVYDTDIGGGYDGDGDKLGDALETAIGTLTNDGDSDNDGINDHDELLGVEINKWTVPPMRFPLMGADPMQPDLFVEVDWQKCVVSPTNDCKLSGVVTPDAAQMQPSDVAAIKAQFAPLGLRIHMDIGIANSDPANFDYGQWGQPIGAPGVGNATQITPADPANPLFCETFAAERVGFFHHYLTSRTSLWVSPNWTVLTGDNVSHCSLGSSATNMERVVSHELGHQLGLGHGGRPWGADVNTKANYLSIMNYGYEWNDLRIPGFSAGTMGALNPTGVDEAVGIGSTNDTVLAALSVKEWFYTVNTALNSPLPGPKGAIDWNRDGVISPAGTLVRASISQNVSRFDSAVYAGSSAMTPLLAPAFAWVTTTGAFAGDWLYVFGRKAADNTSSFFRVSKSQINAGCSSFSSLVTDQLPGWNCANPSVLSAGPGTPAFGMGVAELGTGTLLTVRDQGASIVSSIATIDPITNNVSFAPPVPLPGGISATGDITALATAPGVVKAWVPTGSSLAQYVFQNNAWSGPAFAKVGSTPITIAQGAGLGIGATLGFQDGSPTANVYAVIPLESSGTEGQIMFARQESNGSWTDLSTAAFGNIGVRFAGARPALAYQRTTAGGAVSSGRFYIAWTPTGGLTPSLMTMTEGNLTPSPSNTTKRLIFTKPWAISSLGQVGHLTGLALVDDVNRDGNLRAVIDSITKKADGTLDPNSVTTTFAPLADGIVNASYVDLNDGTYILGNLMASLGHGAPYP